MEITEEETRTSARSTSDKIEASAYKIDHSQQVGTSNSDGLTDYSCDDFGDVQRLNRCLPRDRLKAAALGAAPLEIKDIESLLTDHILDADEHAKDLSRTCSQLVEFLFSGEQPDPVATLGLVKDLSALCSTSSAEMRKSIELLSRIRRQPPPRVQVVSVDGQVNIGEKQVNAVDLGER